MVLSSDREQFEIGNEDQGNLLPHLQVKWSLRTGRIQGHYLENAARKAGFSGGKLLLIIKMKGKLKEKVEKDFC